MGIIESIVGLIQSFDKPQILVAIDGMSASGKTTLVRELANLVDANIFHMDDFFLLPTQRTDARLAEVGGNVAFERFFSEVITPLKQGISFKYGIYDCKTDTMGESEPVLIKAINIIEGAYSMHPYFGEIYDIRVLLTVDEAVQRERILHRNGEFMLTRFINEWIPMENRYIKETCLAERCDIL